MHTLRKTAGLLVLALSLTPAGSASSLAESEPPPNPAATPSLEERLRAAAGEVVPGEGHWTVRHQNVPLLVYAHEGLDRMRIVTPIVQVAGLTTADLMKLLEANYSRALDARYAIGDRLVWGLYVHQLSALTDEELASALDQVVALKKNYGTSYASTDMLFARPPE